MIIKQTKNTIPTKAHQSAQLQQNHSNHYYSQGAILIIPRNKNLLNYMKTSNYYSKQENQENLQLLL